MADDLKAQLEISADASGVEAGVSKAKRSLADLGVTAAAAGKKAADGIDGIGSGGTRAATKVDSATKSMVGSIQRQIAIMEAGSRSGSKYFETLAQQRGINVNVLKPYLDQLDAVAAKQKAAEQAISAANPAMQQMGMSARATAAAMRGVPAQFTDIVTSIQAGQAPITVLLQQGGQLKDMFGGIGPAAKALGGYILGLVNPFTVAAAAGGVLAYAYSQGSKEADAYAKAIILTGNASGATVGQLQQMAERIDAVTGTQSAAAEAIAQFAANGGIAAQSIERFTTVALKMEKETGQAVSETVKQFAELGKSPVDASVKLNEATNYLTTSIYQQIKALSDQGKTADAAALAQKAYADALDSRLSQIDGRLGTIERAWRGVTGAAKEAWDAMLSVGRKETGADALNSIGNEIEKAQSKLERLKKLGAGKDTRIAIASTEADLGDLRQRQSILQENARLETRSAAAQKDAADKVRARIALEKDGDKFLSDRVKLEREIAKARNEWAAAGASQAEIEKRVADIRASRKESKSPSLQIDKSQLRADIEAIKSANDELTGSYSRAESIVSALHAARLIDDRQYYESKRGFIELEGQATAGTLEKQIARLRQEKLIGKDKIDNDKKIADAESKLAILRADTSAKLQVNSIQEVAANAKIAQSYEDARQAAQAYLETIARQNAREIEGIGRGTAFRSEQSGRNQIEDKFTGQRQGLERDKRNGQIDQAQFDTYLQIAQSTYQQELAAYDARTSGIKEKQADWLNGVNEALENYKSNAENVAASTASMFSTAFDGLTDGFSSSIAQALVQGKSLEDGLKNVAVNVAEAFIASFIKIQIQKLFIDKTAAASYAGTIAAQSQAQVAMAGLAAFASTAAIPIVGPALAPGAAAAATAVAEGFAVAATAAAALSVAGGRALGGPVSAGGLYQVNERGPELLSSGGKNYLMMGSQGGNVTPNNQMGGGSGAITIVNNTSAKIGKVTERRLDNGERALILEEAVETVAAQLADPNSRVSRSMGRNFGVQRSR